jgi:hypothetical protein
MKKLIIFLFSVVFVFSCNKDTCDIGNKYAKKYAQGIADRWKCDYAKVYTDMAKILDKTVCKGNEIVNRLSISGDLASLACNAVVAGVAKLGGQYMYNTWSCDSTLVEQDINKLSGACSLIGIL